MSATELRQAAETLRSLCAKADEDYRPEDEDRWFRVNDGMTHTTWARFAATNPNEAPYIATMHPGVGLALAEWLEQESNVCATRRAALDVARLVNGGAA